MGRSLALPARSGAMIASTKPVTGAGTEPRELLGRRRQIRQLQSQTRPPDLLDPSSTLLLPRAD